MGFLGDLNTRVDKPLRYMGSEFGLKIKTNYSKRILFAFPDTYEIGMSHYGSRLLYDLVNTKTNHRAERVYMPWKDAYQILKQKNIPLKSLDTNSKFKDFDVLGFSLEHELSYTNAMAMIELGGLELFTKNRKTGPLVIAGGSGVYNPAPVKPFFDGFFMGEAELAIPQLLDAISGATTREEQLDIMANIPGFWVPQIHGNKIIKRQFLDKLDSRAEIENYITPLMDIVHNRLTYEIQRGCDRGCRFCQAGVVYRPVRQRSIDDIIRKVEIDLKKTGYREIGFLSLNAGDYLPIKELLVWLHKKYSKQGILVSLPSLRIESLNDEFLKAFSDMPKGGFTIAPETASNRLKKVINKNILNDEIIETAAKARFYGWKNVKSYFMTGLPTEELDDLYKIKTLAFDMKKQMKGGNLTVNVSNFIPKPHTPFQWVKQLTGLEYQERLKLLKDELKFSGIKLRWHDPYLSEIEGVFSRGDEKLSELLLAVYRRGEIFTSWAKEFNYNIWKEEAKKLKINFKSYLEERKQEKNLDWDNIDVGVSKKWLKEEFTKAKDEELTEDCLFGKCSTCGVCNKKIKNIIAAKIDLNIQEQKETSIDTILKKHRYRIRFTKYKDLKFLSHIEQMDLIKKIIRRANIPASISNGYKADLVLSFSPPTPDKVDSFAEFVDIFTYDICGDILERLNNNTIDGLKFISLKEVNIKEESIQSSLETILWCSRFSIDLLSDNLKEIIKIDQNFIKSLSITDKDFIFITRKNKQKKIQLINFVKDIRFTIIKDYCFINFKTMYNDLKSIKPIEVLSFVADIKREDIGDSVVMKKLKISFKEL